MPPDIKAAPGNIMTDTDRSGSMIMEAAVKPDPSNAARAILEIIFERR
jgi:hypothetical protein